MTTIEQWVQKRWITWGRTAQESLSALRTVAETTKRIAESNDLHRYSSDERNMAKRIREEIEDALDINGKDNTNG